jgi:hypothetical protein
MLSWIKEGVVDGDREATNMEKWEQDTWPLFVSGQMHFCAYIE